MLINKPLVMILICGTMGFTALFFAMRSPALRGAPVTELHLSVRIKGAKNIPVANARISVISTTEKEVGLTDKDGFLETTVKIPSGKLAVLQASGPQFRLRKDILVPLASKYNVRMILDPQEAEMGFMDLLSRSHSELDKFNKKIALKTSKNVKPEKKSVVPTPVKILQEIPIEKNDLVKIELITEGSQVSAGTRDAINLTHNTAIAVNSQLKNQGIAKLEIRTVWNDEPYLELLPYNNKNELVGGYLAKVKTITEERIERIILSTNFIPKRNNTNASRFLINKTNDGQVLRAYLNGRAVPLIKEESDNSRHAFSTGASAKKGEFMNLAVTGNNKPLIKRAMSGEELSSNIQWAMPEANLSKK